MTTTGDDPTYQHPRCYANTRGGCSTKISGEHFVSHSLIELYHGEGAVLQPSWAPSASISAARFVANVLCEKHNNGLSAADAAALAFATPLKRIAEEYRGGAGDWGTDEEFVVSGDDFQRWLLKIFLTHAASTRFSRDGEYLATPIIDEAVDLLLDRAAWPRTWGMFVAANTQNQFLRFDPFSDPSVLVDWWGVRPFISHEGTEIRGGIVDVAGIGFGLSLFNNARDVGAGDDPDSPLYGTIQRPSYLAWVVGGVEKRITFTWDNPFEDHKSVTATRR